KKSVAPKKAASKKKAAPKKQAAPKRIIAIDTTAGPIIKAAPKKKVVKKPKKLVKEEKILVPNARTPDMPKVRYKAADLVEFKARIGVVRKEAIEELRMLKERLDDLTNYDFAEESMIYSMHMAEQGSEAFEKEKTYAQIQRINEYIKKLDDALLRIKDKSYGVCRVCGCLVAKQRLLAVPITTLSASYKIQKKCPEDGIDRIQPR
ncbi:MAG: hypothetical protein KAH48_10830, partial [Chlorobi bacterium]|nr:hypothetical protein [Chlorobiota bacterium]